MTADSLPMGNRRRYPSDLTDEQWACIEPHIPIHSRGRPRECSIREIVNAIYYLNREGCRWRSLPHDFPKWTLVKYYFYTWRDNGTWEQINFQLVGDVRESEGRERNPSAGIMDSQSVKSTERCKQSGFDGNKKIKGTKRQLLVDVLGLLFKVKIHPADIHDSVGAKDIFKLSEELFDSIEKIWADSGYRGSFQNWVKKEFDISVEIVKGLKAKPRKNQRKKTQAEKLQLELFTGQPLAPPVKIDAKDEIRGFRITKWRWIVERTIAWLAHNRRLSKDYECSEESGEAFCYIGMSWLLCRRLAKNKANAVVVPLPVTKTMVSKKTA